MSTSSVADVIVVGSGPSGALAASHLVRAGLQVLMLDVAFDDPRYRSMIPDRPFSVIRRTDTAQRRYFLGEELGGVPSGEIRVGAQLTPPRQYVTRGVERWLPIVQGSFAPMQSLALGGLGAAWGAACFTYTDRELEQIGIQEPEFARFYIEVAREIGISGSTDDDGARHFLSCSREVMPPLKIDSAAEAIEKAYSKRRAYFLERGLSLGRTPLAVLSEARGDRGANPYFDMDFWSESRRSIFRPRYLVERLEAEPGFRLERCQLVVRIEETPRDVSLHCLDVETGARNVYRARRAMLCAGAINSARIVLNSLGLTRVSVPILCNPYVYIPTIALRMLGRVARDARHSLSQLTAIYAPPDDSDDVVSAQVYSYRSLLLFKLVKEIPLPLWAGVMVTRLLQSSVVVIGVHHSDEPHSAKTMQILESGDVLPRVAFQYMSTEEEVRKRRDRERGLARLLRRLGLAPYGRIAPGDASSIHYAGTLPISPNHAHEFASRPDGKLWAYRNVYVGDSSGWRRLPAKGLTFTIMANAVRVAEKVIADVRGRP